MKIDELKAKYGQRVAEYPYSNQVGPNVASESDLYLFYRWAYRIPKGWYGFALSQTVPVLWARIIDEFLSYLETRAPQFEIHQIKLKFGGLRFYVGLNLEAGPVADELKNEIAALEEWLKNEKLVY